MKKIALIIALSAGLGACSSPPDPVEFPNNSKESDSNSFIYRDFKKTVPLNRLSEKTWKYGLISHDNIISEAEFTKFWFLAHHATHITVTGEENDISTLKQRLISNGTTAEIILVPNCYRVGRNSCPKIVDLIFEKRLPQPQKA